MSLCNFLLFLGVLFFILTVSRNEFFLGKNPSEHTCQLALKVSLGFIVLALFIPC
tara:strand:+ start:69 stop:233 length:165 start_codon:yes stop_codon:yes gene_type:complete